MYGLMLLQEKIKGETLANKALREEDPDRSDRPNLPPGVIEQVALPFGNSTEQSRLSGMVSQAALLRPKER
jgi:hypothetical protein